jgi:DNA-binding transcriptional MerR regulator
MRIDQEMTRQQLSALAGVNDEVLAFWIKNDLIMASSGGEGKGSHRKFDGFQVNIAGVLAELRNLGVNLAGLRAFAKQLQLATVLGKSAECNPFAFHEALELRGKMDAFARGETVEVAFDERGYVPASNQADILRHYAAWPNHLHDSFDKIAAFAARITRDDWFLVDLFLALHGNAYRYLYRDKLTPWGDSNWLAVRASDDDWKIYSSPVGHDQLGPAGREGDAVRSGVFLAPGAIFRHVWAGRNSPILFQDVGEPTADELALRELLLAQAADRKAACRGDQEQQGSGQVGTAGRGGVRR